MDDLIKEKIQFDNDRKIVKDWDDSKPQHVKDAKKRKSKSLKGKYIFLMVTITK